MQERLGRRRDLELDAQRALQRLGHALHLVVAGVAPGDHTGHPHRLVRQLLTRCRQHHTGHLEQGDAVAAGIQVPAGRGQQPREQHVLEKQRLIGAHRVRHPHGVPARMVGRQPQPVGKRLVGESDGDRLRQAGRRAARRSRGCAAARRGRACRSRLRAAASPSAPSRRRRRVTPPRSGRPRGTCRLRARSAPASPRRRSHSRAVSAHGRSAPARTSPRSAAPAAPAAAAPPLARAAARVGRRCRAPAARCRHCRCC